MITETEWKWNDPSLRDNIVVKPVQAVAVYTTSDDELVIRQAGMPGDADSVVIIPMLYAIGLMQGIQNHLNQDLASFQVYPASGTVLDATPETINSGRQTARQSRMERFHKNGFP